MNVKPLLRNAARLGLLTLGGLLGAVAVVWVRANADWATVRLPAVMAPGSAEDLEYEARVYGIVAISFAAGLVSSIWLALAVWFRAIRRERRLTQTIEHIEQQVDARRAFHAGAGRAGGALALPSPDRRALDEFDELEDEDSLVSSRPELPAGYDVNGEEDQDPEDEGGDRG